MSSAAAAGSCPSIWPRPSICFSTAARFCRLPRARRDRGLRPDWHTRSASATCPIRRSISIRPSATRSSCSTGRSPTRRSTATTTTSTNSGMQKQITKPAQALKIRPWTIKIDGMVEKEMTVGIDDLVRKFPIEERLYRHRCVEAWSMAMPWSGFPMAKLVELAKPLSSAKYVRMETFLDKSIAPGQRADLVAVALCRRADDGGGDQRIRLPGHRRLRQAGRQAARRADPARGAVEIRLQAHQVDRALQLHRPAAEELLGGGAGLRVRLLGQRQSRRWRIRAGARRPRS